MKHLGDITKINGAEIEPVWCITGGSPCQDLSVAGKRAGLAGARSGLFMEQVRIVKEMREHDRQNGRTGDMVRPRYLVWENVPGAFSSNFKDGFGDFGAVLEEIVRIAEPTFSLPRLQRKQKWTKCGAIDGDGWSVAWRTHDAQYWGVPQRRRRISVVADFGGSSAGEILFEREGVSGHLEQGEPQRQETAGYLADGAGEHDCVAIEGNGQRESHKGDGWKLTDKMYTLNTTEVHGVAYGINCSGGADAQVDTEKIGCITAAANSSGNNKAAVAYALDCRNAVVNEELSATLQSKPGGGFSYNCVNPVAYTMQAIGQYKDCDVASSCKQRDYKDATDLVVYAMPSEPHLASGKETTGCLMASGYDKLGAQEMFSGDYTVVEPILFDGANVTSPANASNPKPGDPCHTLNTDSRNYVVEQVLLEQEAQMPDKDNFNAKCYGICSYASNSMKSANPHSGIYEADTSRTLDLNGGNPACNQGGVAVCEPCVYDMTHATDRHGVAYRTTPHLYQDTVGALCMDDYKGTNRQYVDQDKCIVEKAIRWIVRRLTPLECTRLQGYPDGWVEIGEWTDSKGKVHKDADSPKYKALGNSIALPFWYWMFSRMAKYLPADATLGSLFDGIGGFPLCWEVIHGRGTARWASEIEEFPIAVTKLRFGEE